jgi:hypothetical protein
MQIEAKIQDLVNQRAALAEEYAAKQRDIEFAILNGIDVEYSVVSARIDQDRQTLQDLTTLRNTTCKKLGIADGAEVPARKIVKMSRRDITQVPVENAVFVPRNATEAIRHILRNGELPSKTIINTMADNWRYGENSFYANVAVMIKNGEVEARKDSGVAKLYRMVTK